MPAGGLLGCHVRDRADDRPGRRFGVAREISHESEIEDDHAALVGDQHVRRLDVPVDLARRVQRIEPGDELGQRVAELRLGELAPRLGMRDLDRLGTAEIERGLDRHRRAQRPVLTVDVREDVDAVDQLHREEPLAAILDQPAEPAQVRVMHALEHPELVLEPKHGIARDRPERLQRDAPVVLAIDGLVHDAHPAGAEATQDREARGTVEVDVVEICQGSPLAGRSAYTRGGSLDSRHVASSFATRPTRAKCVASSWTACR